MGVYKFLLRAVLFVCLCTGVQVCYAQEIELANEYLKNGEFPKAKQVFQKLAKNKETARVIHKKYVECLGNLKEWDEAEKFLKKQIRNNEEAVEYLADLGRVYEQQNKTDEATKKFDEAIEKAKTKEEWTVALAKNFVEKEQIELTIRLIKAHRELMKDEGLMMKDLAKLYRQTGQTEAMIEEYLNYGKIPGNRENMYGLMQDGLRSDKEIDLLEKNLYDKVQKFPNEPYYNDVLIWHLIQQKEFYKAFVQARAMDRRYKLEGNRVMELGFLSMQNKDYKAAGSIFEYLVKEYPKAQNYPLYRRLLINSKEEVVKNTYPVNKNDIRVLINEYQKMFDELGKNQKTLEALRSTANLYAFYLNEKDTASAILDTAIKLGGQERDFVDKCKLDLGDIEVLKNEPWEATLLYSQVEKSSKDSPLGNDAKLRNARLHYFEGDFDLAKDVLDILKLNTTREIANDAIDLGLLILDNTGMDTSEVAMREYARIELMLFQNKTNEAVEELNQLFKKYSTHPLADEILYLRAKTLLKEDRTKEAMEDLEKITKDFSYDVLADDARFLLAKCYDEKLKEKATAMKMYQEILVKYPGSIYGTEARKRFRQMRGDTIN